MTTMDVEYYRRRERQERERAERTEDRIARRVHLELAKHYADRLREVVTLVEMTPA